MNRADVLKQIPAALHAVAVAMNAVGIDWHVVLRNCLDLLAKQAGLAAPTDDAASFAPSGSEPASDAEAVMTSAARMRQTAGDAYLAALAHERACQTLVNREPEEGEEDEKQ